MDIFFKMVFICQQRRSEQAFDGARFARVIVGRGSAVCVQVLYIVGLQTRHPEGILHREESALAFGGRCRLMVGVTAVAVTCHVAVDMRAARYGCGLFFQQQIGRAFSQIDAVAVG